MILRGDQREQPRRVRPGRPRPRPRPLPGHRRRLRDLMADQGFNVVRLLVSWSRLEPERGQGRRRLPPSRSGAPSAEAAEPRPLHRDRHAPGRVGPVRRHARGRDLPGRDRAGHRLGRSPGVGHAEGRRQHRARGSSREDSDLVPDRLGPLLRRHRRRPVPPRRRVATQWPRDLGAEAGVAGYDLLNEPNDGSEPNDTPAAHRPLLRPGHRRHPQRREGGDGPRPSRSSSSTA